MFCLFFFFNDTATTEIYTLSLPTLFRSNYNYEEDYGWGSSDDFGDDYGGWNFDGEAGLASDDKEQDEANRIADKIEWNKKLISKMATSGKAADAINARNNRITALKCQMRDYVCFDGDYFD